MMEGLEPVMADKKQKRVNILLPSFGIRPTGGFKIAYIYANYLAAVGYSVTMIHEACGDLQKKPEHMISYVQDLLKLAAGKKNWFHLHKKVHCRYVFSLNNRTVPHADVTIATAWYTAVVLEQLSERKGRKVYLIQGYEIWDGQTRKVEETWKYRDMKKIVISKWLLDIGKKLGAQNMVYIPNSINFKKYRLKDPVATRGNVVAMIYRERIIKGYKVGIKVLKRVKAEVPDLRVILFGPEERGRNIPSWMEYYENPKQDVIVDDIYNKAAVFLCTSKHEGWGLPSMEAMACGCAVVSTRNGGVEDFAIDEKTALLCKVDDSDAMAEKIIRLLNDQKLRIDISNAGTEYVRRFQWKQSFQTFRQVIDGKV